MLTTNGINVNPAGFLYCWYPLRNPYFIIQASGLLERCISFVHCKFTPPPNAPAVAAPFQPK